MYIGILFGIIFLIIFIVYILRHRKEERERPTSFFTIEKEMDKQKLTYKKPSFYREGGPVWIDFDEGYVADRKEINKIRNEIKRRVTAIVGAPASGKSVILKTIGYKLAKDKKIVYFIPLKERKPEIEEIKELRKCYLIIDDAHLDRKIVEDILKVRDKSVKILIGIREEPEEKDMGTLDERYSRLKEVVRRGIHVRAIDAFSEIIKKFHEIYDVKVSVEDLEKMMEDYKHDLLFLAFALDVYRRIGEGRIVGKKELEETVIDEIARWIKEGLRSDFLGETCIQDADCVLLPLSIFFKYEIKVLRTFLEKELKIEGKTIDELIKTRRINKIYDENMNEMLSLHHSSIAELYLKAFEKEGLGKK